MNLIFKYLKLQNFMSFTNAEISLDNNGFVLISGVNKDVNDNASSNGSGKTSLCSAICWALTNETIAGISTGVKKINSVGDTIVELDFKCDSNDYKIIRSRGDNKANLKVYINGEDKSGKGLKESEEILKSLLPDLTNEIIRNVIIFGQNLPDKFTNNTPSKRKELLEHLTKSDFMIEQIKEAINSRQTYLQQQSQELDSKIVLENALINQANINIKNYTSKLNKLINKDITHEIKEVEKNLTNKSELQKQLQEQLDEVCKLNEHYKEQLNSFKNELSQQLLEIKQKELIEAGELKNSYNAKCIELKSIDAKISELENIKDICPTCGQKLPNVKKVDTTELRTKHTMLNQEINNLQELIYNSTDKFTISKKSLEKSFETKTASLVADIEKIQVDENALREKVNSLNPNIFKLQQELSVLKGQEQHKQQLIEEYNNNLKEQYQNISNSHVNLSILNEKIDNNKIHIEVVNKINTLVKRDFRGVLLQDIINYINLKIKEYSKIVFNNEQLDFILEGNNINIYYLTKPFENLSGGEQQKINIIIQLAIRNMLCEYLNFSCNCLFLDEIFDNLDSVGCKTVLDLISSELEDLDSIYIISHNKDNLQIPYDNEIIVEKTKEGSKILI